MAKKKNSTKQIKVESNKLAAISAIWVAVIIATSIILGDNEAFIGVLPVLTVGAFLSIMTDIFAKKHK